MAKLGFRVCRVFHRLPQLTLPSQKGNQWAPIGWGLPGLGINRALWFTGLGLRVLRTSTIFPDPQTKTRNQDNVFSELYQGDPNQWGPIDSPFGRVELIGEADPMENQKTRKPNLATFGPIIYYISSRILLS